MDANLNENVSLLARIQQLEHERDELRKDIEQLCIQQAGPSYLVVATRMHFERTAALEQEIENLKKKLAASTRDNFNLQEELSEAYRVKSQLADLHSVEAEKNKEAEKQLKFFQGCVATAFAERDQAIMEAEKAKEREETMSQKFNEFQKRLEELTSDCFEQRRMNDALQVDLAKHGEQNETLKEVVDKFYRIRQQSLGGYEGESWDDKCACLLHDSVEMWSYNDASTSKYISALEGEVERARNSVENLRSKLRVGLEIEKHLKKKVRELEKQQIIADKTIVNGIARLRQCHSEHRVHIKSLLDVGRVHIQSIIGKVEEKMRQLDVSREHNLGPSQRDVNPDEKECRDVHISADIDLAMVSKLQVNDHALLTPLIDGEGNASEALAQALREKVSTLLLLSQQEERHLLERNVNEALKKKMEELQRNLLQVTNEKVKALMELAQLKQDYHQLKEKINRDSKQGNSLGDIVDKRPVNQEREGRLRNLLKKTNLRRWVGSLDYNGTEAEAYLNAEGNSPSRRASNMDFARMKIENATLKESLGSMEHLISTIHRLRLALLRVKESVVHGGTIAGSPENVNDIIYEANLVKTALGSSLPISWSAEAYDPSILESVINNPVDVYGNSTNEKIDAVSAAGFEMVELLILAAELLKDHGTEKGPDIEAE